MKGTMKIIVLSSMFLISSHVMADNAASTPANQTTQPAASSTTPVANTGMWICTTNASSPTSGSPDEQADQTMAKNAANGATAFDFALKNCRDCTKITCELQTKPAE